MTSYTAEQIYDALIRQGYDEEAASTMAQAVGNDRVSEEQMRRGFSALGLSGVHKPSGSDGAQDSNLAPNLAEGAAIAAAIPLAAKRWASVPGQGKRNLVRGVSRFAVPGMLGGAASLGTVALTDNNYYDRASDGQVAADLVGSLAGGFYGDKLGERYVGTLKDKALAARKLVQEGAATNAAKNAGSEAAMKGAAKRAGMGLGTKLLGRAAGATGARALGSALGAVGGPIGSVVGGAALGYLLPKLLSDGSKAVEDDDELHVRPTEPKRAPLPQPRATPKDKYEDPFGGYSPSDYYY